MPPPHPKLTSAQIEALMPEMSEDRALTLRIAMAECVDDRDVMERGWRKNDRDLHWDYGRVMAAWRMKEEG